MKTAPESNLRDRTAGYDIVPEAVPGRVAKFKYGTIPHGALLALTLFGIDVIATRLQVSCC
jgi:hypothetical protein